MHEKTKFKQKKVQYEMFEILGHIQYLQQTLYVLKFQFAFRSYCDCLKYSDRQAWANSEDPDQMLQYAASDLGLHWLPLI